MDSDAKPYACTLCNRTYRAPSGLEMHLKVHTGERPFTCTLCDKAFGRKFIMKSHMKVHTGETPDECKFCDKRFKSKSQLKSHVASHTGERPYECSLCVKAFVWKHDLEQHMIRHSGKRPFVCPQCTRTYTSQAGLNSHCKKKHSGHGQLHECSVCKKVLSTKEALKRHCRVHTGEKPFVCIFCGKSFADRGNLKVHCRKHTGEKPYICVTCGKGFAHLSDMKSHAKSHRPIKEKPFVCVICYKAFAWKRDLFVHVKRHAGEKPHICDRCKKAFIVESDLRRHEKKHTGKKVQYVCVTCGKKYTTSSSLTYHQKLHSGNLFPCSLCSKIFSRPGVLKRHMIVHSNVKSHSCHICRKEFYYKFNLSLHLKRHFGTTERPFVCMCSKAFELKASLINHLTVHTRERPYGCNVCGKTYATSGEVLRHARTHLINKTFVLKNKCVDRRQPKSHKKASFSNKKSQSNTSCAKRGQKANKLVPVPLPNANEITCNSKCAENCISRANLDYHSNQTSGRALIGLQNEFLNCHRQRESIAAVAHNTSEPYGCGVCDGTFEGAETFLKHCFIHFAVGVLCNAFLEPFL